MLPSPTTPLPCRGPAPLHSPPCTPITAPACSIADRCQGHIAGTNKAAGPPLTLHTPLRGAGTRRAPRAGHGAEPTARVTCRRPASSASASSPQGQRAKPGYQQQPAGGMDVSLVALAGRGTVPTGAQTLHPGTQNTRRACFVPWFESPLRAISQEEQPRDIRGVHWSRGKLWQSV